MRAACGSRSTTNTCAPSSARAAPRLSTVVVLPTPPFWLATAICRGIAHEYSMKNSQRESDNREGIVRLRDASSTSYRPPRYSVALPSGLTLVSRLPLQKSTDFQNLQIAIRPFRKSVPSCRNYVLKPAVVPCCRLSYRATVTQML